MVNDSLPVLSLKPPRIHWERKDKGPLQIPFAKQEESLNQEKRADSVHPGRAAWPDSWKTKTLYIPVRHENSREGERMKKNNYGKHVVVKAHWGRTVQFSCLHLSHMISKK